MKTFYLPGCMLICCLFIFDSLNAQLLTERFSDGNFTTAPHWTGDTRAWRIDTLGRLNTKDTAVNQEVYLSTKSPKSKVAKWEFLLQMNFNPSAANRFRIYLLADKAALTGPVHGYFLQVGESGNADGFDLYRQDGQKVTRIFNGPPVPRAADDTLRCRFSIRRDDWGHWQVSADPSGGTNFIDYGITRDPTYSEGGFLGVVARYTSTRSGRFYFDDLRLSDPGAGPLVPPVRATWGSVLITEVLPDPSPPAGHLPEAEFFELYNNADTLLSLEGWTWEDQRTRVSFGNDSIAPGEYLIVCHPDDSAAFAGYGRTICLFPFPAMNNEGDMLKLRTRLGKLIDSLSYSSTWYGRIENDKAKGSLERISFSLPCFQRANWMAAPTAAGASPGVKNSARDTVGNRFALLELSVTDSITLELTFNTYPQTSAALSAGNYVLNNGAAIKKVRFGKVRRKLILQMKEPLRRGSLYRLRVRGLTSCYGHPLRNKEREFLLPQLAAPGDVVINELLFNPKDQGADFVEVYNRSGKILDLQDLGLATHPGNDSLNKVLPLSGERRLFYPGEYVALSKYPERVKTQYTVIAPEALQKMDPFPAYNNDKGSCLLLSRGIAIDRFDYNEEMHFSLVSNPEGISLEKIHFDLPPGQKNVFRSAAATAGYATPGYRNSQYLESDSLFPSVSLANPMFSPDNDGQADRLLLNYRFPGTNRVASIFIFDLHGRRVKSLGRNKLLGTRGTVSWDGRSDSGAVLQSGLYVIFMEVFSENGRVFRFRKVCMLARGK